MGIVEDKIGDLKERERKILQMGGEKAVQKQHERGKLAARERLNLLFDPGSFCEIDKNSAFCKKFSVIIRI